MRLHDCHARHDTLTLLLHCTAVGGPKERFFDSPSAFSVYLKRLVNPDRKADDGWKTVKYKDKCATGHGRQRPRRHRLFRPQLPPLSASVKPLIASGGWGPRRLPFPLKD